jgi:antitoxin component of MazEF toxin-antitoxin module
MAKGAEEQKYVIKRRVIKLGDSYAVTLPRFLLESKEIRCGDTVNLLFDGIQGILIQKATEQKRQ